jgi:hypothetical protein
MPKPRGREHTSLTETATLVVSVLERMPGVKMIAPGVIKRAARTSRGLRFVTVVYTTAGMELIITGQSVQKVAVHTDNAKQIFETLKASKKLSNFAFKERERKPGV